MPGQGNAVRSVPDAPMPIEFWSELHAVRPCGRECAELRVALRWLERSTPDIASASRALRRVIACEQGQARLCRGLSGAEPGRLVMVGQGG